MAREILPFLIGQKLEEAKRALEFFSPDGYREGKYSAYDVWPDDEFPLRKRGLARYAQSLMAKIVELGMELKSESSESSMPPKLDRTCLRIADVLIDSSPHGIGLVEIMDRSGASWTAVILHLRHLEANSLVVKERKYQKRGPNVLYAAIPKLAELRELGWIPDWSSGPSNPDSNGPRGFET